MVWRSAEMTVLRWALRLSLICCLGAALAPAFALGITERVSVSSAGAEGNDGSSYSAISADSRYVAFDSDATDLVPEDTNGASDVFVRDRLAGTTERVSVSSAEAEGNDGSSYPSISADGRYVAFDSDATNLVPEDTNGASDVFVRDRLAGTTERVSVSSAEAEGNSDSLEPSISADGRYVAFASYATNLVEGDNNGVWDVFVRDRLTGDTERVSVSSAEEEGNDNSWDCFISADGRCVAFASHSTNLVEGDNNGVPDLFLRDRVSGDTERVSVSSGEVEGNAASYEPSINADGRHVAFASYASNLVEGDNNGVWDVFVRDRLTGDTERVSVSSAEAEGNGESYSWSSCISADGRYVAFQSLATNLVEGDNNGAQDVFVRDRLTGDTERVSLSSAGAEGNDASWYPSISADGRLVGFTSLATSLVPGDTNGWSDVFVRAPAPMPQVLLEVHPNERAPGSSTGQSIGVAPWTRPGPTQPSMYWWQHHRFVGSDALWIQVCAQNWNAIQNGTGDDDNIRMRIDGVTLVDYDGVQNGGAGSYQWKGSRENGHRWTLRFVYLGPSPVPVLHALQFEADETPVIWWIKVTDLEPGVIEAF
jgi:Tol biopolymer transport system component